MNGLMDGVAEALYVSDLGQVPTRDVSFSYIEILGQSVTDCLDPTAVQSGVQVGETLDGRVEMRNLLAVDCPTAAALRALVESAKGRRATESTERNATSSRSHGVGIVTVGPVKDLSPAGHLPRPAAGRLYIIDLAGSERMSDCRGHSDSRMDETKAINVSLMSLKECIRARTLAGMGDGSAAVHVPYRRSKLTLIMKDVFDISCRRLCSTVVIAHTSPLARDVKHSTNTLQYAAPLRVSAKARTKKGRQEVDPRDPACWSRFQVEQWIQRVVPSAAGVLTVDSLIAPGEKGIDLCMMAEAELYNRVRLAFDAGCTGLLDDKSLLGEPAMTANTLYSELWSLICDAKVRRRHPSGALITAEEEAAEVAEKERLLAEKSAMWAEREAHMKSDLVGYDGKPIV